MGNTSSSPKISSQDRAILDLKNQRDKLKQYRKRITVLTDRETEIAKECLAQNDRRRALLALRRKKYQESLLDKTDGQLAQLEQLASQVEFSLVQKDVLFGLQQGTEVLQAINKEMGGIEGVERLMGETAEARAYQEEISQMLEGNLTNQDEDDVEEELEALQRETQPNVVPKLPSAPNNKLPTPEEAEAEGPAEPTRSKTKTRTAALAA
ncbi:SNF7 family protein [Penicillium longicatenatum]|uniref:SNF7 family protein n=1 Tax=Penicillium longicatenatum TaxID=1561947 RepID=UPI002548CEB8|nr:SNF7 family protein [Penicillium longicatenatum]KAJ5630654.1 SNF7 family protein [Penicillium longicatenatum]